MCLVAPGLVISRSTDFATVAVDGRVRRVSTLLLPDLAAGEWVVVAAGTVIKRLNSGEAAQLSADIAEIRREE